MQLKLLYRFVNRVFNNMFDLIVYGGSEILIPGPPNLTQCCKQLATPLQYLEKWLCFLGAIY